MRILFLVYHGFSEVSGISKKIHYQVKGLRENGYEVHLCYYDFDSRGHRCRFVDGNVIMDYGKGAFAGIRQRIDYKCIYDYCERNEINLVYARCFQNANPWLIRFYKRLKKLGIKSVTEIPTYPYDQEFVGFPYFSGRFWFRIDKVFRKSLYCNMNAIVTFSDYKEIFGQRTIRISNGVDFDSIPLHRYTQPKDGSIHLIGVAEVHFWHGYDRLIAGLGEYYQNNTNLRQVFFHIVGGVSQKEMHGSIHAPGFAELISQYAIQKYVVFHGQLFGEELDSIFNQCCFAIGSLARHRSGISVIKTLKNREYATRGLPFLYSEQDSDFDGKSYVLKATPNESPISVKEIVEFVDKHTFDPGYIRQTVQNLSWKVQMKRVIEEV